MRGNILVIDDERDVFDGLQRGLPAHNLYYASTLTGVKDAISRRQIDLAVVDLNLKLGDEDRFSGLEYIKTLHQRYPGLSIIVISKYRDIERVKTAIQNGALDYIWKGALDEDSVEFRERINHLIGAKRARDTLLDTLQQEVWGDAPQTQALHQALNDIAAKHASCWLYGEPGSGKYHVVRYLHYRGTQHSKLAGSREPVVAVPAHFSTEELRLILQGKREKINFLREAHGHILFLKNPYEVSWEIQEGLLQIYKERRFLRQGRAVNIQYILGLEEEPEYLLEDKRLHPDWFQELTCLRIAPLRDRPADLYTLIPQWLQRHGYAVGALPGNIMQRFLAYPYPGNVSELFRLLDVMLRNHREAFAKGNQWVNQPIGWDSIPGPILEYRDQLGDMAYQVAKLELTHIERALQRHYGQRRYKSLVATAVGVSSADNLKKTYIDKYAYLYPGLIRTFPMIVKCYKIDDK